MRKHSSNISSSYTLFIFFFACFCVSGNAAKAQFNYNVLFLGNSYTGVNNLPQLIHDVALSAGDTLVYDSNTPGGYTLLNHSLDAISKNKIMNGGWDYVVIQGQSQEPITNLNQFNAGASALYELIKQYNPCAVTMPYMTWGRKNGDASNCPYFPVMCTYEGMDTTLRDRYLELTESLNGEVSPVSVVWNYLRKNYPNIELYQSDESHPSAAGSYAAACCFYAGVFKKDPALITYDFGLNASDASIIRNAAKTQVFDSLPAWNFKKLPVAEIAFQVGSGINEVIFNATEPGIRQSYFWEFGDGVTSSIQNPMHSYLSNGTYTVSLTATNCDLQGMHSSTSDTVIQFCDHTPTVYTALPWLCIADTLWTQVADSYQWFAYGVPLPETNQYLADYIQYNISGFSVMSAVNGCAELSAWFTASPEWSGYYFDLLGDPCNGDTVAFAVLHINGYLSGLETILWFKNDTLLPLMTNEDTLLIASSGKYECKVIDPNSKCPLDTTSYVIEYACGPVGVGEQTHEFTWVIVPNPATESITIKFSKYPLKEEMLIYSATGRLVRSISASAEIMTLDVADLPNGLYYLFLKYSKLPALKFVKF